MSTLTAHLVPEELSASTRSSLSPERRREILSHLLSGCRPCRAAIGWNRQVRKSLQVPEQPLAWRVASYDRPVASSFEQAIRLKHVLEEQQRRAREAAALLASGEGLAAIPEEGLGVYEALLQRASALRHDDPQETVRLARRAVEVAERLDPAVYGGRQVADFQARAWGELGNALRASDDL
ncbi:MAG TPA: hypothetical protein VGQ28_10640, partial [Thermoanaerobaculia bacterium]|nr:hypothetical protein [Thermoanaerobaculia bacterium]